MDKKILFTIIFIVFNGLPWVCFTWVIVEKDLSILWLLIPSFISISGISVNWNN